MNGIILTPFSNQVSSNTRPEKMPIRIISFTARRTSKVKLLNVLTLWLVDAGIYYCKSDLILESKKMPFNNGQFGFNN
jgi:hypothetical protein